MNGWYARAERQYGVISRSQLRDAGLTDRKIDIALAANRIERLYSGVFRVQGSSRSARQRAMAAVLWCGESALLSYETAASLLRLPVAASELVHVSVPGNRRRTSSDVVVHRTDCLEARDRVIIDGLPCTSGTRTIIDLAAVLQGEDLEHAFETARRFGLTTRRVLGRRCDELGGSGRPGSRALEAMLRAVDDRPKESKLEVKAARLLATHGLRPEASQYGVAAYRVDHAWPSLMFGVESDGFQWHGHRLAWKRDRRRIAELETRGWSLVHVTWDDVTARPLETVERIRYWLRRAREVARGALPA
jgi:very-short-patch-repair endonuclease